MKKGLAANDGTAPRPGAKREQRIEETPISSSGIVPRGTSSRGRRGDSEPPPTLTPYQARVDVEMDDTAVSKVRDPSVSLRLGADGMLPVAPVARAPEPRVAPLVWIGAGTVLGVLVVTAIALIVRALLH
jgi:hypothetical protein